MHALIVGARGVGKSTLIRRVLQELGRPVFGFESKKETSLEDPVLGSPIYLYNAGAPHVQTVENLAGYCKNQRPTTDVRAFDRFAETLRRPVPEGHVVVLDELGFLEAGSPAFCQAVLALLDGDAPVIAAVKDKDVPFLNTVRAHPNCQCFFITESNRDALAEPVLRLLRDS